MRIIGISKFTMLILVLIIFIPGKNWIQGAPAGDYQVKLLNIPTGKPVIFSIHHSREMDGWTPIQIAIGDINVIKWMIKDGTVADMKEENTAKAVPLFYINLNEKQIRTATQSIPFIIIEENQRITRIQTVDDNIPTWIMIHEKSRLGEIFLFKEGIRLTSFYVDRKYKSPSLDRMEFRGAEISHNNHYYYDTRSKRILSSVESKSSYKDIPQLERQALIALYNNTGGDSWKVNSGWKEPPLHSDGFALPGTEGNWYGITVSADHITRIELNNNNLSGTIPPELENLPSLSYLHLNWNQLTGNIPPELSSLTQLESFDLSWNSFTDGPIPNLQASTSLRILNVYNVNRTGNIPTWLGDLTELQTLVLSTNKLTGSIPGQLGNLAKMEYLDISANSLDPGPIPDWIQNFSLLNRLRLFMTNRTGSIPDWMGNLTKLTYLNLGNNASMKGSIPPQLGNLVNLDTLQIRSIGLSGTIPTEIGNLVKLTHLYLDYNRLSGAIPRELGNLVKLQKLYLTDNKFEGDFPSELSNLKQLQYFYSSWNSFAKGPLPSFIQHLSSLKLLYLAHANRNGNIPSWIGNLDKLMEIDLNSNQLSGKLPGEIGNLVNLQSLKVSANQLTGTIPYEFLKLANLENHNGLDISWNSLYTNNNKLRTLIDSKHVEDNGDWKSTQTVAPTGITAAAVSSSSIEVSWTPIIYTDAAGGYRVYLSTASGGPWTYSGTTADKSASSFLVTGLSPNTEYYFVVQTRTNPNINNYNTVISEYSDETSAVTFSAVNSCTLTVQSSPGTGLNITVTPGDNNGNGNGSTEFTRTYEKGTTVTLTAPLEHNGKDFSHWIISPTGGTASPTYYYRRTRQGPEEKNRHENKVFEGSKTGSAAISAANEEANQSLRINVDMDSDKTAIVYYVTPEPPEILLNRTVLNFGFAVGGEIPGAQSIPFTNIGGGILNWTAASASNWLKLASTSGSGAGIINVTIDPASLSAGTYSGIITISDANAINSPQQVTVNLIIKSLSQDNPPIGSFDTPDNESIVRSSIPVTGWALDDVELESVKIYRDPVPGEGKDLVYIGDSLFVEGARPDIEEAYPEYPRNYQAGWGYMMLTNFLPNGGNGTFNLYAIARDSAGHEMTLDKKTITCDNANAVKPFGSIDTPVQGGYTSGSTYINWGWVLTPQPNSIPTDGSTINVYVDGVNLGHPSYNIYRKDIADFFPMCANSSGACGYFSLDTTAYANGVHTIQWTAVDDAGNKDGIGSRYFSIQNTNTRAAAKRAIVSRSTGNLLKIPINRSTPVKIKRGYSNIIKPRETYPDNDGIISIKIKQLERIEIRFEEAARQEELPPQPRCSGYMVVGDQLKPLPIGSTLDRIRSVFHWQPGPGFLGNYRFAFLKYTQSHVIARIMVKIKIE